MPSPLAISNIILSQSDQDTSDATPKVSFYRDVLQPNPVPVLLRVRRARIFIFSTVLAASLVGITYVLSTGITIATFQASEIPTQERRDALVQDYNAYAGSIAALAVKPVQLLAATVLPVWFWSFLTETVMTAEPKRATGPRLLVFLSTMGLVWALSNAFHGANVQLEIDQDSSTSSTVSILSDSVDDSNEATASPNISTETILKSAITMDYRSVRSQCTSPASTRITPTIEYAFPSRPWMKAVVQRTGSVSTLAKTALSQAPTSTSPSIHDKTARDLATYSIPLMQAFFQSSSSQNAQQIDLAALAGTNSGEETWQALSRDVNSTLHKLVQTSAESKIKWLDTPNVAFSFESGNLSSGFSFDSVSFEIPLRAEYMQRRLTLVNNVTTASVSYDNTEQKSGGSTRSYVFDINIKEECGDRACIVSPRGESSTGAAVDQGAQVRALPICIDDSGNEDINATLRRTTSASCSSISSTSFLIFSFAQRLEGESLTQPSSNIVRLKNARKIYSLTVGRLRWKTTPLNDKFMNACRDESTCHGVSFPLEANDAIAVSNATLPLDELKAVAINVPSTWLSLVGVVAQEVDAGGAVRGDLVFPGSFKSTNQLNVEPAQCDAARGKFLATVAANHWYASRSQEQAYTAALLWVFQDGVVGASENASDSEDSSNSSGSGPEQVNLIRLVVRVPRISAIITYCGCAVVLLLSVTILLFSKRHESRIEKHYQPFHLAQTLVGASSPFVPSPALINSDLLNIGGDLLSSSEPLSEFEIMSLTLRHRRARSTFLQVPKPPNLSASASASVSRSMDGVV